jgi:hypothetical protein
LQKEALEGIPSSVCVAKLNARNNCAETVLRRDNHKLLEFPKPHAGSRLVGAMSNVMKSRPAILKAYEWASPMQQLQSKTFVLFTKDNF